MFYHGNISLFPTQAPNRFFFSNYMMLHILQSFYFWIYICHCWTPDSVSTDALTRQSPPKSFHDPHGHYLNDILNGAYVMVLNFLLSSNFKEIQNLFGPLGHNSSAPPPCRNCYAGILPNGRRETERILSYITASVQKLTTWCFPWGHIGRIHTSETAHIIPPSKYPNRIWVFQAQIFTLLWKIAGLSWASENLSA